MNPSPTTNPLLPEDQYPKRIETLVADIYELFTRPHAPSVENMNLFRRDMSEAMEKAFHEDPTVPRPGYLRMSSIGKPARQLWYQMRLEQDPSTFRPLDPQTRLKFLMGDIMEAKFLLLCREAGHTVDHVQYTVAVDGVEGHMDCCIDGVAIDIKSTSSFAFAKFKNGTLAQDDPFGYIAQISGYKHALEVKYGRKLRQGFLAVNKDTLQPALLMIPEEATIDVPHKIKELKEQLSRNTPPAKCYAPTVERNGNEVVNKNCNFCVTPDTTILDENLNWVPAGTLKIGDGILGFEEYPKEGARRRFYRYGKVTANPRYLLPTLKIKTDKGAIKVSQDHKFLVNRKKSPKTTSSNALWVEAKDLMVGDKIRKMRTWSQSDTYLDGWLAGLLDGEGCYSGGTLSVAQNPGVVLDKISSVLKHFLLRGTTVKKVNNRYSCVNIRLNFFDDTLYLMGKFRPTRLWQKFVNDLENRSITVRHEGFAVVQDIVPFGSQEVVGLETTTATYIADGFFSHNCPFKELCWSDANNNTGLRVFKYSNGLKFLTKVVKAPEVEEITSRFFGEKMVSGKEPEDLSFDDEAGARGSVV